MKTKIPGKKSEDLKSIPSKGAKVSKSTPVKSVAKPLVKPATKLVAIHGGSSKPAKSHGKLSPKSVLKVSIKNGDKVFSNPVDSKVTKQMSEKPTPNLRLASKSGTIGTSTKAPKVAELKVIKGAQDASDLKVVGSITAAGLSVAQRIAAAQAVKVPVKKSVVVRRSGAKLQVVAKGKSIAVSKISRSEPTDPRTHKMLAETAEEAPKSEGTFAFRPVVALKGNLVVNKPVFEGEPGPFKQGDKIVYPGHGVGEVDSVKTTQLGGQEHHIYNIRILESGMKVMVPLSQAIAVGLRKIVDKRGIDKVFEILKDRDFKIDTQTWNRRYREYSHKINTGSVYEIAMVLRDLSVLSADKELSFGEKKMLDTAESLLVSEIAIARARPHDKVVGELRSLFS